MMSLNEAIACCEDLARKYESKTKQLFDANKELVGLLFDEQKEEN